MNESHPPQPMNTTTPPPELAQSHQTPNVIHYNPRQKTSAASISITDDEISPSVLNPTKKSISQVSTPGNIIHHHEPRSETLSNYSTNKHTKATTSLRNLGSFDTFASSTAKHHHHPSTQHEIKQTTLEHSSSLKKQLSLNSPTNSPCTKTFNALCVGFNNPPNSPAFQQLHGDATNNISPSSELQQSQLQQRSDQQRQHQHLEPIIIEELQFVHNCLSKHFGKRIRNNRVVEEDDLISWETSSKATEAYRRNRLNLIKQVRSRAWVFIILNAIWLAVIITTQIQAISLLRDETIDRISTDLLSTAEDFSFVEIFAWSLSILVGVKGIVSFQPKCLTVYQIIVALSILFEFIVNLLVLNLVPIIFIKCFILAFFHSFFIFAARMVENAMVLFKERYINQNLEQHPQNHLESARQSANLEMERQAVIP